MASSELVETYRELVDQYDILRQRIVTAEENRDKFKSSVVDRVIADYQERMRELEDQLAPAEEDMFKSLEEFDAERAKLEAEKNELDDAQDEVALRHVLGEYTDEVAEEKKADLASKLEEVDGRLATIEEDVGTLKSLLDKAGAWERREAALRAAEEAAQAAAEESQEEESVAPESSEAEEAQKEQEAAQAAPMETPPQPAFRGESEAGEQGNAFEMILDDFPPPDGSSGPAADDLLGTAAAELKGLTDLEDGQWQQNIEAEFPSPDGLQDVLGADDAKASDDFANLGFGDQLDVLPPLGAETPRTAVLIRNLGTADELRFDLRDDVTSIGRGRDNQIQIKDDTKVSRYHCRVLQEQGTYYVEDNNSSNGTMVNGELITRRKLEGGEDITIGETIFRFQLT